MIINFKTFENMNENIFLTPKDVKKGMSIIEVSAWNFIRNWERNIKRGKSSIEEDVYRTTNWTVHGCGKKIMRLMDEKGMAKKEINIRADNDPQPGTFWGYFVRNEEDAKIAVQILFDKDKFSTKTYSIENHRF